jgi:ADP-ribose pyrophosphatase YjhB (NUDIX family)
MRFCPRCAAPLPGQPPVACAACGYTLYVNARPTGSVIIVDGDRFLCLLRCREPEAGKWEIPGGFCDGWELPAAAAVREAREELGVEIRLGPFVGMYIGSYKFQDEVLPVLDCVWLAALTSAEITLDPTESSAYQWFDLADPPPMAFASMDAAIRDVVGGHHLRLAP